MSSCQELMIPPEYTGVKTRTCRLLNEETVDNTKHQHVNMRLTNIQIFLIMARVYATTNFWRLRPTYVAGLLHLSTYQK